MQFYVVLFQSLTFSPQPHLFCIQVIIFYIALEFPDVGLVGKLSCHLKSRFSYFILEGWESLT